MPRSGWEDRRAKWPDALKLQGRDAGKPVEEVYRNIQSLKRSNAGGLAMTMSLFAATLGVSCDYRHTEGQWDSDPKPTRNKGRRMLGLFAKAPEGAAPSGRVVLTQAPNKLCLKCL